jgi:hypothetical protein
MILISLSKYVIIPWIQYNISFLWWCEMIQCLCDEMKLGKWHLPNSKCDSFKLQLTFWQYIRRRISTWAIMDHWIITTSGRSHIQHGNTGQRTDNSYFKRIELDSRRFHHATQNRTQFTTLALFISGIFLLIFSNHSWVQVTEATECETRDTRWPQYSEVYMQYAICMLIKFFSSSYAVFVDGNF